MAVSPSARTKDGISDCLNTHRTDAADNTSFTLGRQRENIVGLGVERELKSQKASITMVVARQSRLRHRATIQPRRLRRLSNKEAPRVRRASTESR